MLFLDSGAYFWLLSYSFLLPNYHSVGPVDILASERASPICGCLHCLQLLSHPLELLLVWLNTFVPGDRLDQCRLDL